jgi:hypothetical protein
MFAGALLVSLSRNSNSATKAKPQSLIASDSFLPARTLYETLYLEPFARQLNPMWKREPDGTGRRTMTRISWTTRLTEASR